MPDKDDDNYQEISENSDEHYDYCTRAITPPPLPPRISSGDKLNCQTFPRRRKNLFQHLGLDNTLPPSEKNIVIHKIESDISSTKVYKKDLEKYLGIHHYSLEMPEDYLNYSKKDISNFLGIDNKTLERIKKKNQLPSEGAEFMSKENIQNSEGYLSIDSSSSLSSYASYF